MGSISKKNSKIKTVSFSERGSQLRLITIMHDAVNNYCVFYVQDRSLWQIWSQGSGHQPHLQ